MTRLLRLAFAAVLAAGALACEGDDPTGVDDGPSADLESLTATPASLPADGRAITLVRAVIPRSSRVMPRQITFSTSDGLFLPQQQGATRTLTVAVDAEGVAVVPLQAPSAPTVAVVRAQAGATSLQDTVRFVPAQPDLVSFALAADSLPADEASTVLVRAVLRRESTLAPREVTFETSAGTFAGGTGSSITVRADSTGTALALLRAPLEIGSALVRARAGVTTLQGTLRFVRALPQSLVLSADSFKVAANPGRPFKVRASLRRSPGRVTPGATVTFTAADTLGVPVGWFAGATEPAAGQVEVSYTPGSTPYRGRIRVIGRTPGEGGTTVSGELFLEVTDP